MGMTVGFGLIRSGRFAAPAGRTASVGMSILMVLQLALLLTSRSAGAQSPVTEGYRDFSFGTALNNPTGEKPESKLWWNDGSWWGSLWNPQASQHRIHRFDSGSQSWTDTGTVLQG